MTHIHTFNHDLPWSTNLTCNGCDLVLRFASYDEAVFVHETGTLDAESGPIIWNNNCVIVPLDFSLFQEA